MVTLIPPSEVADAFAFVVVGEEGDDDANATMMMTTMMVVMMMSVIISCCDHLFCVLMNAAHVARHKQRVSQRNNPQSGTLITTCCLLEHVLNPRSPVA